MGFSGVPIRKRISFLDVCTVLVLSLTVYLLARPGSALHASTSEWLSQRRTRQAIERNWRAMAATAEPLFDGPGDPDIIEFSDYECPFCRSVSASVDSAVGAGIKVSLIHLPLSIHPRARSAALASICAGTMGRRRETHSFLMTTTGWRSDSGRGDRALLPGEMAQSATDSIIRCMAGAEVTSILGRHLSFAETLKVMGTPTFIGPRGMMRERPTAGAISAFSGRSQ